MCGPKQAMPTCMNVFYRIAGQQDFKNDRENPSGLSLPRKPWRRTKNK